MPPLLSDDHRCGCWRRSPTAATRAPRASPTTSPGCAAGSRDGRSRWASATSRCGWRRRRRLVGRDGRVRPLRRLFAEAVAGQPRRRAGHRRARGRQDRADRRAAPGRDRGRRLVRHRQVRPVPAGTSAPTRCGRRSRALGAQLLAEPERGAGPAARAPAGGARRQRRRWPPPCCRRSRRCSACRPRTGRRRSADRAARLIRQVA